MRTNTDAATNPIVGDIVDNCEVVWREGDELRYLPPTRGYEISSDLATWRSWAQPEMVTTVAQDCPDFNTPPWWLVTGEYPEEGDIVVVQASSEGRAIAKANTILRVSAEGGDPADLVVRPATQGEVLNSLVNRVESVEELWRLLVSIGGGE